LTLNPQLSFNCRLFEDLNYMASNDGLK